jgi:hypothetical protein
MPSAAFMDYAVDLNNNVGGLKLVHFIPYSDVVSISEQNGIITNIALASGKRFYEFQVAKNVSSYTSTPTRSGFNVYYQETINLVINKLTSAGSDLLQAFVTNTLMCIAEDRNGEAVLLGRETGLEFSTGNAGSGTASNDRNGYDFTLTGTSEENFPR